MGTKYILLWLGILFLGITRKSGSTMKMKLMRQDIEKLLLKDSPAEKKKFVDEIQQKNKNIIAGEKDCISGLSGYLTKDIRMMPFGSYDFLKDQYSVILGIELKGFTNILSCLTVLISSDENPAQKPEILQKTTNSWVLWLGHAISGVDINNVDQFKCSSETVDTITTGKCTFVISFVLKDYNIEIANVKIPYAFVFDKKLKASLQVSLSEIPYPAPEIMITKTADSQLIAQASDKFDVEKSPLVQIYNDMGYFKHVITNQEYKNVFEVLLQKATLSCGGLDSSMDLKTAKKAIGEASWSAVMNLAGDQCSITVSSKLNKVQGKKKGMKLLELSSGKITKTHIKETEATLRGIMIVKD